MFSNKNSLVKEVKAFKSIGGGIFDTAEKAKKQSLTYEIEKLFGDHKIYSWEFYKKKDALIKILSRY